MVRENIRNHEMCHLNSTEKGVDSLIRHLGAPKHICYNIRIFGVINELMIIITLYNQKTNYLTVIPV